MIPRISFPETNNWHLKMVKMDGWNTFISFLLGQFQPIFRGELAGFVSGSVMDLLVPATQLIENPP